MVKNTEQLKQKVASFLKDQPSYNENKRIKIKCDNEQQYFVLYGEDIRTGITGFGPTPQNALDDFIDNWNFYSKRERKNYLH
jgi:hypothetical protein